MSSSPFLCYNLKQMRESEGKKTMKQINLELREYIRAHVFPDYSKNDPGHQLNHIEYVIRRSLLFMDQFDCLNADMVYAAAAYHDIAHHINKDQHEALSAKAFWENEEMKRFFTDEQRRIIREAIEDHRSSSENPPRNDYGRVISSADRSTDPDEFLRRTHAYSRKHFPEYTEEETRERCRQHMRDKYGRGGYAKSYVKDEEYIRFCSEIERLLEDRQAFDRKYSQITGERKAED